MYFSKRTHLLSYAIMASAVIRLLGAVSESFVRMLVRNSIAIAPDMMDSTLWKVQIICSFIQIILMSLAFMYSWRKLQKLKGVICEEDRDELGRLQEEFLGEHLSSLSALAVGQLIQIWAVIMVGAECIYFVVSMTYRQFTSELMLLAMGGANYTSFVSVYNMTHGFKYLEILTAILLGVIMTGIFLNDRYLKAVALIIAVCFLLAFSFFQMQTIVLSGKYIGIVWTSVIFHFTETIGMFILSLYLSKHYRGL